MDKFTIIIAVVLILAGLGYFAFTGSRSANDSTVNQATSTVGQTTDNASSTNTTNMDDTRVATNGDMVLVHYTGKLTDGTVFDSSVSRGQPFSFLLGAGMVIPGWEKGIQGMKIGEKKTLTISPEDGYGARGVKDPQTGQVVIPGNATLVFDVELIDIKR